MTGQWPQFSTKGLGTSKADDDEMLRRWQVYDREMQALIKAGGLHQDEDGWWVDDATGELIGPDPEIERPLSEADMESMRPLTGGLTEVMKRSGSERSKEEVTLQLDAEVAERLRASGPDWQSRVNEALKKVVGL